ncbi:unnamed protein product [Lactuca saligna]|uniref:Uncharacterized protein n=1 Tax=Lactuca saligna TaxID=75948 RepID=A0AA35VFM3_LACSI|nr:unnamed protein product [Lactuca saligna]
MRKHNVKLRSFWKAKAFISIFDREANSKRSCGYADSILASTSCVIRASEYTDSRLDLPITLKSFKFHSFVKVSTVPSTDSNADQFLFSFYLKHMNLQYETWGASKITAVKVTGPIETESSPNAMFKVVRGSASQVHEFTLADLPCLNPYDWIMLYNLLLRDGQKYEAIIAHLKLMIVSYVQEVGKMDVEIVGLLRRKLSVLPKEALEGFDKLKSGKIYKEGWYVVFQA